ncbi:hypothetical protein CCMA1212_002575 [Trichoderma ghanense]|uniref:Uncharacterized protein n=1 Tax=Trichoderma ghanense TaxID=65468 RepID=A0ABY2HDD3_9HYPO
MLVSGMNSIARRRSHVSNATLASAASGTGIGHMGERPTTLTYHKPVDGRQSGGDGLCWASLAWYEQTQEPDN